VHCKLRLEPMISIPMSRSDGAERDAKIANTDRIGGEIRPIAHVSRRAPISLYTIVACTEEYTCAANLWVLSFVQ
jgi:hypothetical protein